MKREWVCSECEQVNQQNTAECIGCGANAELSSVDMEVGSEVCSEVKSGDDTIEPKATRPKTTEPEAIESVVSEPVKAAPEPEQAPEGALELWLAGITMGTSEQARPLALASILVTAGLFIFLFIKALLSENSLPLYAYAAPILPYMGCKIMYDVMHGKAVYMRVGLLSNKVREVTASYKNVYSRFLMLVLALVYILGGFYLLRL